MKQKHYIDIMKQLYLGMVIYCALFVGIAICEQRIVSLSLISDEVIVELFKRANKDYSQILALSSLATNKDYSNMDNVPEAIKNFVSSKDIEKILFLKPTLVFVAWYNSPDVIHMFQFLKVPTHIINEIKKEEDIYTNIITVGKLVNLQSIAQQLVNECINKLNKISYQSKKFSNQLIKVINFDFNLYLMGEGTTFDFALSKIGVQNLAKTELKIKGIKKVNLEVIIKLNPDYLVVPVYNEKTDIKNFYAYLEKFPALKQLKCIREKKIIFIHYKLFSTLSHHFVSFVITLYNKLFNYD